MKAKTLVPAIIANILAIMMTGVPVVAEQAAEISEDTGFKPSAAQSRSDEPQGEVLLNDSLGRLVKMPANALPQELLPPSEIGLKGQIPSPARGTKVSEPVLRRLQENREGKEEFQFFPSAQPQLMPYLASQDEFGNTAISPGALIRSTPLDALVQRGKYLLSEYGLRYSLQQTYTFVDMTHVMQGGNALGFYTADLAAKWAIFNAPGSGMAGWISAQVEAKASLGHDGWTQSAQTNLGTFTNPTSIWSSVNGFRIPELAWQQSFFNGKVVVLAGMVSQGNYIDVNSYANSGRGQFLNSALINSMVMPLSAYNPGVNLQWQPDHHWYAMFGASAGNTSAGSAPWTNFSWQYWSTVWEIGYMPDDLFGLGPGVYRIQPFVARAGGPTQGGLCFNIQQQLGKDALFGYFGRFGFGGSDVVAGASAQVANGFVMKGPLKQAGLFPTRDNDAMGIGFVWSRPSTSSSTPVHKNEFVLEMGYVLQLTPMAKLQPDLQVVWNPAYNSNARQAVVFQVQIDISW